MRALASGLAIAVVAAVAGPSEAQVADLVDRSALRVCADPANLPLSAEDESGFENRIAELLGEQLGRPVQYTWFPQVTGFVRQTLQAGKCDLVMGYAQGDEFVLNTNHYYTSTHVIVVRADGDLADVETIADPLLRGRRIGVVAGSPPATHVARLGMMKDAKPYELMTDRRVENPAGDMLADVASGDIDAALLWGPVAGPLVGQSFPDLQATPLLTEQGTPRLVFRITMGVRAGEDEWKRELNSQIRRNQAEIDAVLREAGVPILDDFGTVEKPGG